MTVAEPLPPPIVSPVVAPGQSNELADGLEFMFTVSLVILAIAAIVGYRSLPGKNTKQKFQNAVFFLFIGSLIYSVVLPLAGLISKLASTLLGWFDISWKPRKLEFLFEPHNLRNPIPNWAGEMPGATWIWSLAEIWWVFVGGLIVTIALGFLTLFVGYPSEDEMESSEDDSKVTQQSENQSSKVISWNWLWPDNRIANPGTVARLGRVIHWAGVAVGAVLIAIGILIGVSGEVAVGFGAILFGLAIGVFSRGILYIFAGE